MLNDPPKAEHSIDAKTDSVTASHSFYKGFSLSVLLSEKRKKFLLDKTIEVVSIGFFVIMVLGYFDLLGDGYGVIITILSIFVIKLVVNIFTN
jgi:hypothetical protein